MKQILLICVVIFIFGCSKEVVHKEPGIRWEEGNQGDKSGVGGHHGGGGGNCVGKNKDKCRPIESFHVKIWDTSVFKKKVLPILEEVYEYFPELGGDLIHKSYSRMWYIVPIDLNKLPSSIVGAPVKIDNLGQIALQNSQEIWMSNLIYEKLDDEDKVNILIHELVMGIRIMEYSEREDHCDAKASQLRFKETHDDYKKEKRKCYPKVGDGASPLKGGFENIKLAEEDYEAVRKLTLWILEGIDNYSIEEISFLLNKKLKRSYKEKSK